MPHQSLDALETFSRAYWRAVAGLDLVRLGIWEHYGLSMPQLRVLFYLSRHPGAPTRDLAAALGVTMPTVSALVQKLVEAGLVRRGQDPSDRRLIPLYLTQQGEELTGLARASAREFVARVADALGTQLPAVTSALERLARAVEQAQSSEGMPSAERVAARSRA